MGIKLVLKSPTLEIIRKASLEKGCLISANQSSLFFASELEQKAIELGIVKPEQIERKRQIELIIKMGYAQVNTEKIYISESLLNHYYNIIENGYVYVDVEQPLLPKIKQPSTVPIDISMLIEELVKINSLLNYFYEYSIDAYQERMFNYNLLSMCVLNSKFKPIFKGIDDVLKQPAEIIQIITMRFIEFKNYIPECVFRALARGESDSGKRWLATWNSCKAIGRQPFDELDDNKMNLIRWTIQYENIRQGYEVPPDDIMDNDAELDNWLFYKKIDKNSGGNSSGLYFENKNAERAVIMPNAITFEA